MAGDRQVYGFTNWVDSNVIDKTWQTLGEKGVGWAQFREW